LTNPVEGAYIVVFGTLAYYAYYNFNQFNNGNTSTPNMTI